MQIEAHSVREMRACQTQCAYSSADSSVGWLQRQPHSTTLHSHQGAITFRIAAIVAHHGLLERRTRKISKCCF